MSVDRDATLHLLVVVDILRRADRRPVLCLFKIESRVAAVLLDGKACSLPLIRALLEIVSQM